MNEVDKYISKSYPFAQPILKHLRSLVHEVCPQVEEKMKWSFPHFDYSGEMMCSMAAFKQHCSFGFWKAALMKESSKLKKAQEEGMGHLGRITDLSDLPSDSKIKGYIKEAMLLNDRGIKMPSKSKTDSSEKIIEVPDFLKKELKRNPEANKVFQAFAYSHKKEYVLWIIDAKTEVTREKRMATMMDLLLEGKSKNWKYERKK